MHLRGGWCRTHLVQAKKFAKLVKTREKLKTGLYGLVTRKKTGYKCELKLKPGKENSQPGPSVGYKQGVEVGRFLKRESSDIRDFCVRLPGSGTI